MGPRRKKSDPTTIPKGYTVVIGPDKKTQYMVPDFAVPSLEQIFAVDRVRSSITVPSGSGLDPQAKALPTNVTLGNGLHASPDPPLCTQELLALHAEVGGLQQQLGISYQDAVHRLYTAEMEKLKAADAKRKTMENLDRKFAKSLKGLAKRHNVDSKYDPL